MAAEETLGQLMSRVRLNIDNQRARLGEREERPPPPFEPKVYTSREAPEEIDTVAICPAHPDLMVLGTYSLVKKDEPKDYEAQMRKGMLIIMPIDYVFRPSYPGQLAPYCDQKKFPCAVLDIHFHPSDGTLLGVATSNAQIHFYRVMKHANVINRRVEFKLVPLGSATIAPKDKFGLTPVVTQFDWIGASAATGTANIDERQLVELVATTTLNEVILVQASFAAIRGPYDLRMSRGLPAVAISTTVLHTHKLETWCVNASLVNMSEENIYTYLIASGADDSALVATGIETTEMGPNGSHLVLEPMRLFMDKRSHTAGVTAVLIVEPTMVSESADPPNELKITSPILTGSYDEHLRLFFYDPYARKHKLVLEHKMKGGVWRIKQMDRYAEDVRVDVDDDVAMTGETDTRTIRKTHYLLLLSCLHAGANVVRLTHIPHHHDLPDHHPKRNQIVRAHGWQVEVVAKFSGPHDSMVYASDFRREYRAVTHPYARDLGLYGVGDRVDPGSRVWEGEYTVVSTSFYDRRVCVWGFVDEVQRRLARAEEEKVKREELERVRRRARELEERERAMERERTAAERGWVVVDKKAKRRSMGW